jgi:hypothetical protein
MGVRSLIEAENASWAAGCATDEQLQRLGDIELE